MMKKISKVGVITSVIAVMLFAGFASSVNASNLNANGLNRQGDTTQQYLEEMLVGTWRWTTSDSWIIVFRPDGTGVDGPSGLRTEFVWNVINDRLYKDGIDQNIRVHENTITIDRRGSGTHSYVRYSDETEAETSLTVLIVIGIIVLIFVVGVIILVIVLIIVQTRKNKRYVPPPSYPPPTQL